MIRDLSAEALGHDQWGLGQYPILNTLIFLQPSVRIVKPVGMQATNRSVSVATVPVKNFGFSEPGIRECGVASPRHCGLRKWEPISRCLGPWFPELRSEGRLPGRPSAPEFCVSVEPWSPVRSCVCVLCAHC